MLMAVARTPPAAAHELPAMRLALPDQPLRLYRGGEIEQPVIAYETWGSPNAARDNTLLLFTGLSPSAHAASSPADPRPGWWESMIGEGRPIDTRRFFVVCVNSLGSPFGSSGPASADPRTGRPYGIGFPEIAVEVSLLSPPQPIAFRDEADAQAQLVPGADGVIFEYGHHRSTFLPQVWAELAAPAEFMGHLKYKAGLPPDFWDPAVKLSRYAVVKWREGDPVTV
jgi:hypothetical protein